MEVDSDRLAWDPLSDPILECRHRLRRAYAEGVAERDLVAADLAAYRRLGSDCGGGVLVPRPPHWRRAISGPLQFFVRSAQVP